MVYSESWIGNISLADLGSVAKNNGYQKFQWNFLFEEEYIFMKKW